MVASRWSKKSKQISALEAPTSDTDAEDSRLEANDSSKGRHAIFALDILSIDPIPGVTTLKGDFLSQSTHFRLNGMLRREQDVDVVLSDMGANATGNPTRDISQSLALCEAALQFAERRFSTQIPRPPGSGSPKVLV